MDELDLTTPQAQVPPEIAKAIIAFQRQLKPLKRTADNSEYGSKYTPLEEVVPLVHSFFAKKKIAILQPPTVTEEGQSALETVFVHESGVTYRTITKLAVSKIDPQVHGSSITYMRRYALCSILGITTEGEDDDGNAGAGKFPPPTEEQLDEIKSLCTAMKYTTQQIASKVFTVKTRDHAALTIRNLQKMASERERDNESKDRAEYIEFGPGPDDDQSKINQTEQGAIATLTARMVGQGLTTKALRNKFVLTMTEKPFLANCTPEEFKYVDQALARIEAGKVKMPANLLGSIPVADKDNTNQAPDAPEKTNE